MFDSANVPKDVRRADLQLHSRPSGIQVSPGNAAIRAEGDKLVAEGNTIVSGGGREKEQLIRTPGGQKTGRRPDIIYETPQGDV